MYRDELNIKRRIKNTSDDYEIEFKKAFEVRQMLQIIDSWVAGGKPNILFVAVNPSKFPRIPSSKKVVETTSMAPQNKDASTSTITSQYKDIGTSTRQVCYEIDYNDCIPSPKNDGGPSLAMPQGHPKIVESNCIINRLTHKNMSQISHSSSQQRSYADVAKKRLPHKPPIIGASSVERINIKTVQVKPRPPRAHIFVSRISSDTKTDEMKKWIQEKGMNLLSLELIKSKYGSQDYISLHITLDKDDKPFEFFIDPDLWQRGSLIKRWYLPRFRSHEQRSEVDNCN